jgi:pentatricopeptide repeat protein
MHAFNTMQPALAYSPPWLMGHPATAVPFPPPVMTDHPGLFPPGLGPPGLFCPAQTQASVLPEHGVSFFHELPDHLLDPQVRARELEKAAIKFYKAMHMGYRPGTGTYNRVISAAAALGEWADAYLWLLEMKREGIRPTLLTYNCFMSSCARHHRQREAELCLTEMRQMGITPDSNTYSLLITACARCNDADGACRWMHEMVDSGLPTNKWAYAGVVEAFASTSEVDKASTWLDEMCEEGLDPSMATYCRVLCGAAACSPPRADVAEKILLAMRQGGMTLNWRARAEGARAVGQQRLSEIEAQELPLKEELGNFLQPTRRRSLSDAEKDGACSGDDVCSTASGSIHASAEEAANDGYDILAAPPGLASSLLARPPGL